MAEKLDQDVVNLAKAIRQVESGNRPVQGASGEMASRYQYMPSTWKATAQKYLGDPNAPLTLENENKATYLKLKDWKDAGYGPDQIASMWNAGPGRPNAHKENWRGTNKQGVSFDTPAYVKKVENEYKKLKQSAPQQNKYQPIPYTPPPSGSASRQADETAREQYGAIFAPNTQDPSAFAESAKLVGNMPTSAFNLVKGAVDVINPISIFNRIKDSVSTFKEIQDINQQTAQQNVRTAESENELIKRYREKKGRGEDVSAFENYFKREGIDPSQFITQARPGPDTFQQIGSGTAQAGYETLVPESVRGIFSAVGGAITGNDQRIDEGLQTAQRALVSDPVGQIAPWMMLTRYGMGKVKGAKGTAAFDRTISNVARPVTRAFESIGRKAGDTSTFAKSQATGFQPETVRLIEKYPEEFTRSKVQADPVATRGKIGSMIQSEIGKRQAALKETGKLYEPIRNLQSVVKVNKNWLADTLKAEAGLTLKNGKFEASAGSKIRTPSDVRAIQQLYDTYAPNFRSGKLTPNEYLNLRSDLAEMARYDRPIGKSKPVDNVGKATRRKLNEAYRKEIEGLEALDKEFKPQRDKLEDLTKGLVDKQGNFKPTAYDNIANAVGKTYKKGELLKTLEEISPGVTTKLKAAKAIEDIQRATGIKVGTYSRTGLVLGAGVGLGVLQAIITAILTSPEVAVPILRRYGILKNSKAVQQVINALKKVNEVPEKLPPAQAEKNVIPSGRTGAFSVRNLMDKNKIQKINQTNFGKKE